MGAEMPDKIECHLMTWDEMQVLAVEVAKKIQDSGYKPDLVVALARGGLVPARAICDFLVLSNLVAIKVEHWGITAGITGQATITYSLNIDLKGKKILLVDDITDTGESMLKVLDYVHKEGVDEVKTATLMHITGSKYEPDFHAKEIKWKWVIFPWNFHEDMTSLVPKIINDKEMTLLTIQAGLKDTYSLDLQDIRVMAVLEDMESKGWLMSVNRDEHIYWKKIGP
ncbi:MAG: phosphoribosyltransferase [Candidatus Thermoplasmatota archaeon]|nr:phosphoribosyltransferase [Candidatus Thermoplasmatota archaeon]